MTNSVSNVFKIIFSGNVRFILLSFPVTDTNDSKIKFEGDLRKVATWCCENQLLINPDKTKFMSIGTRQLMISHSVDLSVSFMGRPTLSPVDSARDLGVIMDSHLTYDSHISYFVSSCLPKLVEINRVKKSFDKEILTLITSSLVLSKMFSCSSVWFNTSKNNIKKLQLIQNVACRIITGSQKYDHVTPLLQQLNWLSVNEMLQFRDSFMAYKCARWSRVIF